MRKAAMNYLRTAIYDPVVGYLVEGRVRFTGQLIDAVTGAPWADRFERDFADVFLEVTVAVVCAIQPKLLQREIALATRGARCAKRCLPYTNPGDSLLPEV
jgi:hypothetical protein